MKGIDDADGVVALTRIEVCRGEFRTSCGGQNGAIPVGGLATILEAQGGLHQRHGKLNDRKSQPEHAQSRRIGMGKRLRSAWAGGLDVKFLKLLDRKSQVVAPENFPRLFRLGAVVAPGANRVEQDVGVNEGQTRS